MTNQEYLGAIALMLSETDTTMDTNTLIDLLNHNGKEQTRGGPYVKGGRGIFKLISSAYDHFESLQSVAASKGNITGEETAGRKRVAIAERFVEVGTQRPAWVQYEN